MSCLSANDNAFIDAAGTAQVGVKLPLIGRIDSVMSLNIS